MVGRPWVGSIHKNLSIQPVPIRLNDASLDALAETVECSLVQLMEKSVLCAVHRLHGASHDGASFDDDVPTPVSSDGWRSRCQPRLCRHYTWTLITL